MWRPTLIYFDHNAGCCEILFILLRWLVRRPSFSCDCYVLFTPSRSINRCLTLSVYRWVSVRVGESLSLSLSPRRLCHLCFFWNGPNFDDFAWMFVAFARQPQFFFFSKSWIWCMSAKNILHCLANVATRLSAHHSDWFSIFCLPLSPVFSWE